MKDTPNINYNELEFLRKNTMLGPVALLKIQNLRNNAKEFRNWYYKIEGELLAVDYSEAEALEYRLRLKAWENKIMPVWQKYGQGWGLTEFAEMVMEQQMEKPRTKSK